MVVALAYFTVVIQSHTCRREVLCSFFWTLEERWWNSTAMRPRWANSWFGLDSSANMLKELSSLFSWLASSMFSWGRRGITPATDPAWRYPHRWSVSQTFLSRWLSVWANNYICISTSTRLKDQHSVRVIVQQFLWKAAADLSQKSNQFVLLYLNLVLTDHSCLW